MTDGTDSLSVGRLEKSTREWQWERDRRKEGGGRQKGRREVRSVKDRKKRGTEGDISTDIHIYLRTHEKIFFYFSSVK